MQPLIAKKEIAQARFDICKQCPRLSERNICNFCNCYMPIKVKFARASCPANKWVDVSKKEDLQDTAYQDLK